MAAATTTATLTAAMKTYYMSEFLSHFKEKLVLQKYGQTQELPASGGTTADWFRYHPLPLVTSAGTEGQATSSLTAKALDGFKITKTVATWYQYVEFSELLQLQGRDPKLTHGAQLLGQNAAESIERETLYQICEHCIWPLPVNAVYASGALNASVYQEGVLCETDGTTTTLPVGAGDKSFVIANASVSTSTLVGGWVCVSKGRGYGYSGRISAYTLSERIITVQDAMPEAPDSDSADYPTKFTVATPFASKDTLASGDVVNTKVLQKAEEILFKNGAEPYPGGWFALLIHPTPYAKLAADSTWVNAMSYRSGETGLETNEIGRWSNFKVFRMTTAARYAATAATNNSFSSTTGPMYVTLACGQNGWGQLALSGRSKPEVIIEPPSSGGVSNPAHLYGTMAWKLYWAVVPLNANFVVGIMSYED